MMVGLYPKKTIKITTKTEYDREMKRIIELFSQKETEETWDQFKRALDNLSQWIADDKIHTWPSFEQSIRELKLPIIRCLESPRTLLSASASGLLKTTARHMETHFATKLNPLFIQAVIKQFGSTNKVHAARVLADYKEVIEFAKLPKCIPLFSEYLTNKTKHKNNSNLRACLAECFLLLIQVNSANILNRCNKDIEKVIHVASSDASASVRSTIRSIYKAYAEKMPELFAVFDPTLTSTERKHLEAKSSSVAISRSASLGSLHRSSSTTVLPRRSSSTQLGHKRTMDPKKGTHALPTLTRPLTIPQHNTSLTRLSVHTKEKENTPIKKTTTDTHTQVDNDTSSSHVNSPEQQPVIHTQIDTLESNSYDAATVIMNTEQTQNASMPELPALETNCLSLSSSPSSSSSSLPSSLSSQSSLSLSTASNMKRQHEETSEKPVKKQKTLPPISTTMKSKSSLPPRTLPKPTQPDQSTASIRQHETIGSDGLQRFSNRRFVGKPFFPKKEDDIPKLKLKKKGFGPNFRFNKRV